MFSVSIDDHLKLMPAEPALAEAIYAEADRSRATLAQWLPWAENNSLEGTRTWVRLAMEQWARGDGFHAVILERGVVAGVVGYVYARGGRGELGYWLGDAFRGRGIMTRAVRFMMVDAHTRLKLHRMEVRCRLENAPSRAVPIRLGIPQEAVLRGWLGDNGVRHDIVLYARIATDPWGG